MTDPVTTLIMNTCASQHEERPSRIVFDMDKLFRLAEINGLNVDRFKKVSNNPFYRGRVRMNIGNLLRGKYNREGSIVGLNNEIIELV